MHTCASFDAAKDERIDAEAIVTVNRASKYTRASSGTYMSRIEPGSELEDDEETARREHSYTCQSNINARGEDAKESNTKQADRSGGAAYRARVTHLRRRGAFEEGWQRTPASTQDRKHDIVRDNMKDQSISGIKETEK